MNTVRSKHRRTEDLENTDPRSCSTDAQKEISKLLMQRMTEKKFGDLQMDERFKRLERTLKLCQLKKEEMRMNDSRGSVYTPRWSSVSSICGDLESSYVAPSLNASKIGSEVVASSTNMRNYLLKKKSPAFNSHTMATSSVKRHPITEKNVDDFISMPPPKSIGFPSKFRSNAFGGKTNAIKTAPEPESSGLNTTINTIDDLNLANPKSSNTTELSHLPTSHNGNNSSSQDKKKNEQDQTLKVFFRWRVMLNDQGLLIIKGVLNCGKVARSKPVIRRLTATSVQSIFKHTYYLQGNIVDDREELPDYVRGKFYNGFPDDWENVYQIWRSFLEHGCSPQFRWPTPITDSDDDLKSEITDITYAGHGSARLQRNKSSRISELSNQNAPKLTSMEMTSTIDLRRSKHLLNSGSTNSVTAVEQTEERSSDLKSDSELDDNFKENAVYDSNSMRRSNLRVDASPTKENSKHAKSMSSNISVANSRSSTNKLTDIIREDKLNVIIDNLADKNCPIEYINKILEMFDCLNYVVGYRSTVESESENTAERSSQCGDRSSQRHFEGTDRDVESKKAEMYSARQVVVPAKLDRTESRPASVIEEFKVPNISNNMITVKNHENSNFEHRSLAAVTRETRSVTRENCDMSESETYAGIPKIPLVRINRLKETQRSRPKRYDTANGFHSNLSRHNTDFEAPTRVAPKNAVGMSSLTFTAKNYRANPVDDSSVSITEDEMDVARSPRNKARGNIGGVYEERRSALKTGSSRNAYDYTRCKKRSKIRTSQNSNTQSSSHSSDSEQEFRRSVKPRSRSSRRENTSRSNLSNGTSPKTSHVPIETNAEERDDDVKFSVIPREEDVPSKEDRVKLLAFTELQRRNKGEEQQQLSIPVNLNDTEECKSNEKQSGSGCTSENVCKAFESVEDISHSPKQPPSKKYPQEMRKREKPTMLSDEILGENVKLRYPCNKSLFFDEFNSIAANKRSETINVQPKQIKGNAKPSLPDCGSAKKGFTPSPLPVPRLEIEKNVQTADSGPSTLDKDKSLPTKSHSESKMKSLKPAEDSNGDEFGSEKNPMLLAAWVPVVTNTAEPGEKCGLIFKGKVLNEACHIVHRKFSTQLVRRRLSSKLIETVNQEFFRLVGDMSDTSHVVPKQLSPQCRSGCPANIDKFCKMWRSLKAAEGRHDDIHDKLNSSKDISCVPTSSRGRRILPPLSYWTGERVAVKDNEPVYSSGTLPECSFSSTLDSTKNSRSTTRSNNKDDSLSKKSKTVQESSATRKTQRGKRTLEESKSTTATSGRGSADSYAPISSKIVRNMPKEDSNSNGKSVKREPHVLRRESLRTSPRQRVAQKLQFSSSDEEETQPTRLRRRKPNTRSPTALNEEQRVTKYRSGYRSRLRPVASAESPETVKKCMSRNSPSSGAKATTTATPNTRKRLKIENAVGAASLLVPSTYHTRQRSLEKKQSDGITYEYREGVPAQDDVLSDDELSHF